MFQVPDSCFLIPCSCFLVPASLLLVPCSLFLIRYSFPLTGYFSNPRRLTFVSFISINLLKHENFIFFPENHAFTLAPVVIMTSCKDDEPTPDTATIHGTITIDNAPLWATWQDSGEVQLTIFPAFVDAAPPAGAGWGPISPNVLYPGFPGGTFALGAPYNSQNPLVLTYVARPDRIPLRTGS